MSESPSGAGVVIAPKGPSGAEALVGVPQTSLTSESASTLPQRKRMRSEREKQVARLIAGGVAGSMAKTVVAPLERMRIMAQTGHANTGMVETGRLIVDREGIKGLWRGNFVNCVRVFPSRGILFSCNDMYKLMLAQRLINPDIYLQDGRLFSGSLKERMEIPFWLSFTSGSIAGMTACVLTYPLDVARTRMSGRFVHKDGTQVRLLNTLTSMVKKEGITSWYRGIAPTLIGAVPYEGIKFAMFDVGMSVVEALSPETRVLNKLVAGAFGGACAGLAMYPNDTVRRMMQMQGHNGAPIEYRNSFDCYRKLYKTEGISRFFKGIVPYLVRMMPNSAIQFGAYAMIRETFEL
mmetsp:Transcript_12142/g.23693  ORF Transcript_12142/g.23693 Transcript_12142/m.23693 type:complete len:350 (-) Transcript_12142:171-1220(-)|eukprot:CAMPEP_0171566336 /NCGR_PEP_ID=MMETSP0961-20121227/504_1 /TAXON_ID=87120 /ORGANISM="Aurantiochytrium limacinum, Strain ATCCMYA-1381" /LENGTH=349 /DNA_ID=CAMNT_0012120047 /DNA_START=226 /DNA_END=1275 /DNA_ORIENTATION=-